MLMKLLTCHDKLDYCRKLHMLFIWFSFTILLNCARGNRYSGELCIYVCIYDTYSWLYSCMFLDFNANLFDHQEQMQAIVAEPTEEGKDPKTATEAVA